MLYSIFHHPLLLRFCPLFFFAYPFQLFVISRRNSSPSRPRALALNIFISILPPLVAGRGERGEKINENNILYFCHKKQPQQSTSNSRELRIAIYNTQFFLFLHKRARECDEELNFPHLPHPNVRRSERRRRHRCKFTLVIKIFFSDRKTRKKVEFHKFFAFIRFLPASSRACGCRTRQNEEEKKRREI